jgi:hypothetical protein
MMKAKSTGIVEDWLNKLRILASMIFTMSRAVNPSQVTQQIYCGMEHPIL